MENKLVEKTLQNGTKVTVYRLKNPTGDYVWALYEDGGKTKFQEREFK